MIRVALADDQALVRSGFSALLSGEEDITVVGESSNGLEAVHLAKQARPDVLLMDIRMPELDGVEATRLIAADAGLATVHVVILTTFEHDEYVFEGLRAGAAGFLVKDTECRRAHPRHTSRSRRRRPAHPRCHTQTHRRVRGTQSEAQHFHQPGRSHRPRT